MIERRIELSKARKIIPVLTIENQNHWLGQAAILSKRELEKELAEHCPTLATQETTKTVSKNRIQFGCGLDEDIFVLLKDVRSI